MPQQRIKGQETEVLIVADGEIQSSLTEIQSFEFSQETATSEEGYLGEKANRYDEIYNGFSFSMEMHHSTPDLFALLQIIKDRAQRRTPGVQINIKTTLNYPSGERVRIICNDVFFDSAGISVGGRDQYATTTLPGKGSEYRVLA
jgi:hypothetical protein